MKKSNTILLLMALLSSLLTINAQTPKIDSLESLLQKHIETDTVKVNLLNQLAYELYLTEIDKTLEYAQEARLLADKLNFFNGKAESLRLIGIYYYIKSDYPQALDKFQESLKINQEIKNKRNISSCLNNIGLIYWRQDKYLQALELFQKSLTISKALGDKKGISKLLNNIGLIQKTQGNPQALDSYKESLKINKEINNKRGVSMCLNNIGNLYLNQNKYAQALDYYQESLKINKELGYKRGISVCLINIGLILIEEGDYSKALDYCQKALKIYEDIDSKYGISSSYIDIGAIYFKINNYSKALDYTLKSFEIAKELELIDNQKKIHLQLAKIYATTKDFKKAYENYVLYKKLSDSLFNEKKIKKITGLEYQYEYEKAKQATELEQQKKDAINKAELKRQKMVRNSFIVGFILMLLLVFVVLHSFFQKRKVNRILLAQKNKIEEKNTELLSKNKEIQTQTEELKTTTKKLEELNATKDKFFSIIAHDLKSPFNSILGFSNLLLEDYDECDDIEIERYLKMIDTSAKQAYKLLDNLLNWARVQTKGFIFNPKEQSLNKILIEVTKLNENNAEMKNIKLSYSLPKDINIYADYDMIEIILRNLISNAIKFTPKNGEVKINAEQVNDNVIISVSDTGVGMEQEKLEKIFDISEKNSTAGTENETGTGLGLILCKEFIEKHNGKIWIESEIGKGSKFIFSIPNNFN